jgi:2-(1,2-epoxy-1,2-dihydrophenyl)acetyl-CoA isomerase
MSAAMTDDTILTHLDEHGVMTVTLNRPAAKNAFTTAMQNQMLRLFRDLGRDPAVRVVILTGAGQAFCTGGDVKSLGAPDPDDAIAMQWATDPVWLDMESRGDRLIGLVQTAVMLQRMPKPTIAMVRGAAAGAGVSLALACDFRIASESAFFLTSFTRIGTSGDFGGAYFLTHLVGPSKAKELLMLGDRIDAAEAYRIGLLNRLVTDAALEAETSAFARRLAAGPPVALRYIKENVRAAAEESLDRALEIEARNMARTRLTQDSKEAMAAFLEKRTPTFKGY